MGIRFVWKLGRLRLLGKNYRSISRHRRVIGRLWWKVGCRNKKAMVT